MTLTLGELAQKLGLELRGEAGLAIRGVCALAPGKPGHLSFLTDGSHRKQLVTTQAAAVILHPKEAEGWHGPALLAKNPHAAFARAAAMFEQRVKPATGVHPSAWVSPQARLDPSASVGPMSVVEAGAQIGPNVEIGPGCVVGRDVKIGDGTRLVARVTLCDGVTLGRRCNVEPGAVLGARGFGLTQDGERWLEVPQLGSVVVGDDVEIGANTTVDRATFDNTVIEDGVKLDNQVHVGHNCRIGKHTAIAGCVGISGSSDIGARCQIGGAVGIAGQLRIADDVVITGYSLVTKSVEQPGLYSSGIPIVPAAEWRRQVARLRQLDEVAERLRALEKASEGKKKE